MYVLEISDNAKKDITWHKKAGNKLLVKKIDSLLFELIQNPKTGTGKPEQLKFHHSGKWARKINDEQRLIYSIDEAEKIVNVLSAKGHYEG